MKRNRVWMIPVFIVVTILSVAAGPTSAGSFEENFNERYMNFSMREPQTRSDEWQSALARFAVRNPAMSRAQSEAILALMEIDDPAYFQETVDLERREILVQRLTAFGKAFSYNDVTKLLRPLKDIQYWMTRNKLFSAIIVEAPTCNCSNGWDCTSGYSCQSVECISKAGSNSSGVCTSKTTVTAIEQ